LTQSDDLGRIVIPKEIRRTLCIKESAPSLITLSVLDEFGFAMVEVADRVKKD